MNNGRSWRFRPRLNLGSRLTLCIGLVIGITSLAFFVGIYRLQEQQAQSQLETQAHALLTEMVGLREWIAAYGGVWTTQPGELYLEARDGFYRKSPAMVTKELSNLLNARSSFYFHITSLRLKNPANAPDDFERQALHGFEQTAVPVSRIETLNGARVYRVMIPLKAEPACLECHADQGYRVGDIRGGLSVFVPMAAVDQNLADSRLALIFSAGVITALVMIVLYVLVRRVIVAPVSQLKAVAVAVGQGDYSARCQLHTGDELEMLGETWNQMIANLQTSHDALQKRVEQRTKELDALSDVALTLSRAGALEEVLSEALETVLQVTSAAGGVIHLVEPGCLRLAVARGLSNELLANLESNAAAQRLMRQVLETGQPSHVQDLGDETWQRACFGATCAALVVVPLRSRDRALGTLTLFSSIPTGFAPETVQLLSCIGNQLGVAVEKAQFHKRAEQVAVLEERARIARELHDSLAQTLGYLSLKTELVEGMLQHGEWASAQSEMSDIRRVVREACYDVRESIDGLRTRLSDGGGLIPAAARYLHEFGQRAGLLTEYVVADGEMHLTPVAEIEVLRIIQEALMNVRKHAQASHVRVIIKSENGAAHIEIADDGCGFDPAALSASQHFGLRVMRERAERLGGTFQVESAPGQGTCITVRLKNSRDQGARNEVAQD